MQKLTWETEPVEDRNGGMLFLKFIVSHIIGQLSEKELFLLRIRSGIVLRFLRF